MNINDYQLDQLLNYNNLFQKTNNHSRNYNNNNKNEQNQIQTLILDLAKIYSIETKKTWYQIEYLSLRNSLIKNIDFIINMPNLFYLDLYQNPIEVYTPLLTSNTFGYFSFSPPLNYFEQKILSIEKLNVIFFIADIKDQSIKKNFLQKNPNIMVLNNEIIDFEYKIKLYSASMKQKNDERDSFIHSESEKLDILMNFNLSKLDTLYSNKFKVKNKEGCTNNKILEIEKFIKDYNKRMLNYQKDGKKNYNQTKVNLEEKKKLIAICDCYLNILDLNNNNESICFKYIPLKEKIDKEIIENSSIKYNEIKIIIFKKFTIPSLKEFLLSVLILFIFKILSKDISFEILKLILLKSNYYIEDRERIKSLDDDILSILNLESNLLICLYYKIYDIMFGIYSNKRLSDIQLKLQINGITDKVMNVIDHQNNFIKIIKNNSDPFKKAKIIRKELIFFLNENDIFNNILIIIQYVYDYIIYNSIQKKLALKNSKDLQFFLDIKNYMYFSLDKKQNDVQSMAEKNYNKIQMISLFNNKFFFDTENYKKTTQFFNNVFLNYKHGIFYPDKNKIKKIKNQDIEEELKNKEKEKIKKLYVQNKLNSFFNVIKEQKQLKENKNYEIFKSKYIYHRRKQNNIYKNKKNGNSLKIKTLTNNNNFNHTKNTNSVKIKKNNIRKIEDIDFELVKKSQDKLYKTSNNLINFYTPKKKILSGIDTYFNINKKIYNPNNNDMISSLQTETNFYTNHNMYKTSVNNLYNNNHDYLKLNSMNEVLNNLDISAHKYLKKLKNKFVNKNIFVHLNKRNKTKSIKFKNIKIENKINVEGEPISQYTQGFYYNKSLGCRINYKKIILDDNFNYSGEGSKKLSPLPFHLHELSSVKKLLKGKKEYNNYNIDNKTNINSYSDYGIKISLKK